LLSYFVAHVSSGRMPKMHVYTITVDNDQHFYAVWMRFEQCWIRAYWLCTSTMAVQIQSCFMILHDISGVLQEAGHAKAEDMSCFL